MFYLLKRFYQLKDVFPEWRTTEAAKPGAKGYTNTIRADMLWEKQKSSNAISDCQTNMHEQLTELSCFNCLKIHMLAWFTADIIQFSSIRM